MSWSVPKLGALAEVASGNLTLAEPAGIAQGDLMIACIGYRSNAPFTVPGDWNLVATQQSSGDTDATNGIASGVMMWCVRGPSAPTLTFNRTAGDVAQGRIIAYSGVSANTPFDTGSANTLGVASATVTTAGFNTAQAGELLVAMVSCGDNLTTSAFDATDPSTASGATDTTTAPTEGTWIERADSGTNLGADHGLAIADAIRATAGATGTIQATVSAIAQHVMIAAAFKLAVSSPSPSVSPSASVSPSSSQSPSSSVSLSVSPSGSVSPSSSSSLSVSPSGSQSPSSSESPSVSPSSSGSPSSSTSPSTSPSGSASLSVSPSASASPSSSTSLSISPSSSSSPSLSPSSSVSPSPPPPPPDIVFLDPGGDAVQALGYFNTEPDLGAEAGVASFDSAQEVVGVGSYKFDSGDDGYRKYVEVTGVLGTTRRVSCYFRYNSVPDTDAVETQFGSNSATYSGGGFSSVNNLPADDATYATATPAKNSGQGNVLTFTTDEIPVNASIDSVKIIYERKYDTADSIGISRVKYRINGVEGPDHDDTNEPTTDTVVTVDVTADRPVWERQDLNQGVFEVIAEARRGDSDTSHTQSWDYVKVEVAYHIPVTVLRVPAGSNGILLALLPRNSGVVLKVIDGALNFYEGTTELAVNTWYRISFGYVINAIDDLDIKVYVNGVQELSITAADTDGAATFSDLNYGWHTPPGNNKSCWFDQIYIDDGDDLSDTGNMLITAKLPAAVNENTWDTTGTGAINERPVSFTNYRQQLGGPDRQTYTLQTAAVGDIDISSETLLGYMGWAIAATSDFSEEAYLVLNNVEYAAPALNALLTEPGFNFLTQPITSASYPSHAAGIGMKSSPDGDTILLECGAVIAYQGPEEPPLLPYQQLNESTITEVSDDAALGATYALRNEIDPTSAVVTTTISSSTAEGEVPQQQAVIESRGGDEIGVTIVAPGSELTAAVAIADTFANVELRRID